MASKSITHIHRAAAVAACVCQALPTPYADQPAVDPVERFPSLFELAPDETIPLPTPLPEKSRTPFDPRLETLRRWDEAKKEPDFPELPSGGNIHELARLHDSSEEEKVQKAIEYISFETTMREAKVKSDQGLYDESIAIYMDGLAQITDGPMQAKIHQQISQDYFRKAGRNSDRLTYENAARHMELSLEFNPSDILPTLSSLAGVYLYLNQIEKAIQTLDRLNMDLIGPNDVQGHFTVNFNYACAYSMAGDVEKAVHHIEQAANWDPASTISSLGDPQLDNIRKSEGFVYVEKQLIAYFQKKNPESAENSR